MSTLHSKSQAALHETKIFVRLAHNVVDLPQQLQLHVGILLEEQQHEEEADGQRVWRRDHHLQHALPHVLRRQLTMTLESHRHTSKDRAAAEEAQTFASLEKRQQELSLNRIE